MIDFNVDYIANTLRKTQRVQRAKGMNQLNVTEFFIHVQALQQRRRQLALNISFTRILVARRPHPQYLLSLQPMMKRKQEQAVLMIKRFCALSDRSGQIKADQKLNYPFVISTKVLSQVEKKRYETGFDCTRKYARFNRQVQIRLERATDISYQYQKRIYLNELFTIGKRKLTQIASYRENSDQLVYILATALRRKYQWALGHLSVRLMAIQFIQADKQKIAKRQEAVKGGQKRNQIINELKKKIATLKGQSHEGKIQNNKKKTDGSRQNGTKMMRKTEEFRNLQTAISQTNNQIARFEQEIIRKKAFISARPIPVLTFEQMQSLYNWANQSDSIQWKDVQVKVGQSKTSTHLWIIQQSVLLKQLINIHERVEVSKKSDAYTNADNENTSLKGIIGSLIRSQYFEARRQNMMNAVKEVENQLLDFKQQMQAARSGTLLIKQ